MAKETRLKEDALVAEMQPQVAAQPATPTEVAAAQAAAPAPAAPAAPVDPLANEDAPENFNNEAELAAGIEEPVDKEAVEVTAQISKEDLAAAVATAMNTGDVEAAEAEVPAAPVPAAPEAPAPAAPAAAPGVPVKESLSSEELDVIKEYRKYKAAKLEEAEEEETSIDSTETTNIDDILSDAVLEDADDTEADIDETAVVDEVEGIEDEQETDSIEANFPDPEPSLDDNFADGNEVEVEDRDLADAVADFLNGLDIDDNGEVDAADALRQVADFIETGVFEDKDVEDSDVVEEPVEDEEPIEDANEPADVTEMEDEGENEAEEEEEDEVGQTDLDNYAEKLHSFIREAKDVINDINIWATSPKSEGKTIAEAIKWATGAIRVLREAKAFEAGRIVEKGAVKYPAGTPALNEDINEEPLDTYLPFADEEGFEETTAPELDAQLVQESVEQEEPLDDLGFDEEGFEETTAPETEATIVQESMKEPTLTRKQVIQNYRNAVARKQEFRKKESLAYNRALNNGVRLSESSSKKIDPNSWAANKTIDRFKEKLNIEDLFNDNLLG